jgi:hypothetical protein
MPPEDDNFAKAFEELAAMGDKSPPADFTTQANAPAPETTETTPETPPAGEAPPPADGIVLTEGATETTPPETPPEVTPPAPPPAPQDDDARLARFAKALKEEIVPQQPVPQPQPEPEPELYSPDERKALEGYLKEWPDVAKAEALMRRAEYRQFAQYIEQSVIARLTPIVQTVQTLSERTQLTDLRQEVTDYDDVRDKVVEWVDKQPAYLKPAYMHVVQQGTVGEVRDLIERYRRDSGATAPVASAAPPAAAPAQKGPAPAVKQAAAALAPVSSKRSGVAQAEPTDFDSAFEAFASKV